MTVEPERDDQAKQELAEVLAAMKVIASQNSPSGKTDQEKVDAAVGRLPGKGEWIKAAPGVAFVCGTLIIVSFLAVFVTLSVTGGPTDQLFRLVNLFLNALGGIATLATLAVAMMAARRMVTARQEALKSRQATEAVSVEVHQAADAAKTAATALNGDFETRLQRALGPLIQQAAERAAREAYRAGCNSAESDTDDDESPAPKSA